MASLQCGSFLESSKYHFVWMTCHILNEKRASLLCWSFHASSMNQFLWMTRHILNKWRACLHFHFHAPSIYHFLWMTCHICYKVRASLLCGSFHVPWNGHSGRNILSKMSPLIHLQITSFSEWLVTLSMDVGTTVGPFMCLQMVTLAKSLTTLEQANGISPVWVSPCFFLLL